MPEPIDRSQLLRELQWASRANPDSPSRRVLRRWFARPEVLDYLEELVARDLRGEP